MNIIETTLFYILILLICLLFCNIADKHNNKKMLALPIIILTLVCGLRSVNTGIDTYANYLGAEYYYKGGNIFNFYSYAPGYGLFCTVIYKIWHNYNFLLSIEGFITIFLIFHRLWDFRNKASFKAMIFSFLMTCFIDMLTLKVQFIALAIAFFSTRYLENNNKNGTIKYIILTLIACSIHVSAFINFLIIFFYKFEFKKLNKRKLLNITILAIFMIIIFALAKNIFTYRYMKYYLRRESQIGLMNFIRIFMLMSTIIFNRFLLKNEFFNKNFKITLTGLILNFMGYIVGNAGRAIMYLTIYNNIIFGMVQKDNKVNYLYKFLLIFYVCIYTFYVISQMDIINGYLYNFFFKF